MIAIVTLSACSENTGTSDTNLPDPVDETQVLLDSIAKLETVMKSVQKIGQKQQEAFALISCYKQFADRNPKHERAPEMLFLGADVATGLKQYTQAVVFYKDIYEHYKDYEKRPVALFLIAFTYDDKLKDLDQAAQFYQRCIDEYPGTRVAQDAAAAMDLLGLTDEEIIKRFEAKNAEGAS